MYLYFLVFPFNTAQNLVLSDSTFFNLSTGNSVFNIQNLTAGHWFDPWLGKFLSATDDNQCNEIHASITDDICFDNGYVEASGLD